MLTSSERESFALQVMTEVKRWPGVEMRPHASGSEPGESDGVEFRLCGRQIGHLHTDCAVHLSLTKALRENVISEQLAEPLSATPSSSGWTMFNPISSGDSEHAIFLLRLNYIRLRRQRLTPGAAAENQTLQQHERAVQSVSNTVATTLQKTQARTRARPIPGLSA